MAFNVAKMAVQLGVSAAGFASGLRSAKNAFKGFSKSTRQGSKSWADAMGASFASTIAKITILVLSIKRVMRVLLSEFKNLDEARKFAQSIGQAGKNATDKLLAFEYAAARVGASSAVARTGLRNMSKAIGEAQFGFGEGMMALRMMGLDAKKLGTMLPTEAFIVISKAMNKLENSTLKTAAAQKLFGKAGVRMLNLARLRGESIDDLIKRHERLAGIMSEADIAGVEAVNDAFNDLITSYKGLQRAFIASISPALFAWLTTAANLIAKFRETLKKSGESINTYLIKGMMKFAEILPGIIIFVKGLWRGILNLVDAVMAWDEILGAMLASIGLLNSADNDWATRISIVLAAIGTAFGYLPEIARESFTMIKGKLDQTAMQMRQAVLKLGGDILEVFFKIGEGFLTNVVRPIANSKLGKHLGLTEGIDEARLALVQFRNLTKVELEDQISEARRWELAYGGVFKSAALRLGDLFKGLPAKIRKDTKAIQKEIQDALKEFEKIKKGAEDPFSEKGYKPPGKDKTETSTGPRFAGFAEIGSQAAASLIAQTESDVEMETQNKQLQALQEMNEKLRELVRSATGYDMGIIDPTGVLTRR